MTQLKSLIEIEENKVILNSITQEKLRIKLDKIRKTLPMLSPRLLECKSATKVRLSQYELSGMKTPKENRKNVGDEISTAFK